MIFILNKIRMQKKLLITEEQYYRMKLILLETEFSKLADDVIQKNDIITIVSDSKKFNFKVLYINSGQVTMFNIDKGSEFYGNLVLITKNDFDKDKLKMRVAKTEEQKKAKASTWPSIVMKKIDDITVSRNGKVIDGIKESELKHKFIETINNLSTGKVLKFKTGNIEISLIYQDKLNNSVHFIPTEETKKTLKNENTKFVEISMDDKDIVSVDDNILKVSVTQYDEVDGKKENKHYKINISNFEITNNTEEDDSEKDDSEKDDSEKNDSELDKETVYDLITKDPKLKQAFYKRPNFWQSFVAELTGDKPTGSGFITVSNLINNYLNRKITEKFGNSFSKKGNIQFEPIQNVQVRYSVNKKSKIFNLDKGVKYDVEYNDYDDSDISNSEYNLILDGDEIRVIVKEKTKTPNIYVCDVIKKYKEKTQDNPKGEIKYSEPTENVQLKFIDGGGYKADKDDNVK